MFTTFGALKTSNLINVAGVSPDSEQFRGYVNEATSRLLNRGDWEGSVVGIQVCIRRGCVVFPRYVLGLREARVCKAFVPVRNIYYSFVPKQSYYGCGYNNWDQCEQNMLAYGEVPTYASIAGEGRKVRAYPRCIQDFGKTLTVFGVDNNGQPLMHRDENGDWRDGIVLTLKNPYAESLEYVRRIDRVLKDPTQQIVNFYAYNVAESLLEDLAYYDASETNPAFARYQVQLPPCNDQTTGEERQRSLTALVKLRFIPVVHDEDIVLIDDIGALKQMVMAIRMEEGGDDAAAQGKIDKAVLELNMRDRNMSPDEQTTVQVAWRQARLVNPI